MNILTSIGDFFSNLFNGVIDWVLGLVNGFFSGIGDFISSWLISQGLTIEIPSTVFDILDEITIGIGYLLPISALMPIVFLWLGFYVVKIVFALYKSVGGIIFKRI